MTDENGIVVAEPTGNVVATAQGAAGGIMAMIERAATDSEFSVVKMEKMVDMYNQSLDRTARESYMRSMSACQAELPAVAKDAENSQTSSQYATIDSVNRAIVPVITKHGFSLTFGEDTSPKDNCMRITCVIGHRDGHSTEGHHLDVPIDVAGIKGAQNKTWTHAMGSTATYGRRYLTMMLFNVTLASEDDDGNVSGGAPIRDMINTEAHNHILELCQRKGKNVDKVLDLVKSKYGAKPDSVGLLFMDQAQFAIDCVSRLPDLAKAQQ